jgi:hypothetical protein
METVEHFAQIALVTHILGQQRLLACADLEKLVLARQKYAGVKSPAPMPIDFLNGNGSDKPQAYIRQRKHLASTIGKPEAVLQVKN